MCDSILLPKIIANFEWSEARQVLQNKYHLSIDESDKLFCAKYAHGSPLWTRGTEEQKLMLTQNRGTIYSKVPPYRLVCLPFYKFWNYNEDQSTTTSANWNLYSEKMDGCFFKLYYFENEWHVSSNSRIDIKQFREKYRRAGKTNEQLWNEAAREAQLDCSKLNANYCYFFERVHPDYKIVIQYHQPMLYHLGTRDMSTLEELEIDIGVPKPRTFQFDNFSQCLQYVNQMQVLNSEGIVACDTNTYQRIKIKAPSYLIIHYHTIGIDNQSKQEQFFLSIWLQAEKEEYFNYFPEYRTNYHRIEREIERSIIPKFIDEFTKLYDNDRKRFFEKLNMEYPSTAKSDHDRKRFIFNKLFHQYHNGNWHTLDDEQKFLSLRNILRERNIDNSRIFIFEKYLRSLITIE